MSGRREIAAHPMFDACGCRLAPSADHDGRGGALLADAPAAGGGAGPVGGAIEVRLGPPGLPGLAAFAALEQRLDGTDPALAENVVDVIRTLGRVQQIADDLGGLRVLLGPD